MAVVAMAECVSYGTMLNARTKALEARLAQLEVEVKGIQPKVIVNTPAAFNNPASANPLTMPLRPDAFNGGSLEARVAKIERELTPHMEPIQMAQPR